jgi:hypothetical protein
MRTVEFLQISSAIVGAACTALAAAEQRLIKRLRKAGACSPGSAVELSPIRPPTRWSLRRLLEAEAVGKTESGAVFLDEGRFRDLRRKRVRVAAVLIPTLLVIVFALYLLN